MKTVLYIVLFWNCACGERQLRDALTDNMVAALTATLITEADHSHVSAMYKARVEPVRKALLTTAWNRVAQGQIGVQSCFQGQA